MSLIHGMLKDLESAHQRLPTQAHATWPATPTHAPHALTQGRSRAWVGAPVVLQGTLALVLAGAVAWGVAQWPRTAQDTLTTAAPRAPEPPQTRARGPAIPQDGPSAPMETAAPQKDWRALAWQRVPVDLTLSRDLSDRSLVLLRCAALDTQGLKWRVESVQSVAPGPDGQPLVGGTYVCALGPRAL